MIRYALTKVIPLSIAILTLKQQQKYPALFQVPYRIQWTFYLLKSRVTSTREDVKVSLLSFVIHKMF